MAFDRIIVEPDMLEGKPCLRGLRITVETVVRLVDAGWSFEQILEDYPDLERADIQQPLEYAATATDAHTHRFHSPAWNYSPTRTCHCGSQICSPRPVTPPCTFATGAAGSSDPQIIDLALTEARTIVSADTDLGAILASTGATEPSVNRR